METIDRPPTLRPAISSTPPPDYAFESEAPPMGAGWLVFSSIVLGLIGVFGFLDGILAISSSKVFTANATYVFSDLHTWGWIVTILSALTMVAAVMLFTGSEFARWFGIIMAGLYGIGQLMFVHANPWWSVSTFAVAILVIYGLAVHAGSRLRPE